MEPNPTPLAMIANGSVRMIAPELLLQELRSDVPLTIIDVREREERKGICIPNARCYPLHQLRKRIDELAELMSTPVVVVSQSGSSGRTAAVVLTVAGFADVAVLEGGMGRWIELGYPVEERASTIPPPPSSSRL